MNQQQNTVDNCPQQEPSYDVFLEKYAGKDEFGNPVEYSLEDTFDRVATALAAVEKPEDRSIWKADFLTAMRLGAIPAGRILSNAGIMHRRSVSLINCTVSRPIIDSIQGINEAQSDARTSLSAGCGIGYEFSTLRPKGAFISGVGAGTSGALSFMKDFDTMCANIASAGGRRGAQMCTFDIGHPEILDFIKAKRQDGVLRQFNLSVLITDEFMTAVKNDYDWPLSFPYTLKEIELSQPNLADPAVTVWRKWPIHENYLVEDGLVACKIYDTIRARDLWDIVMKSTYDYAEPGILNIDRINEFNNLRAFENIRATNPCAEQPLPPFGSCLLGSINLTKFIENPFQPNATFNFSLFKKTVGIFSRMLDNVVELHGLKVPEQAGEILRKRRHGMGITGLGSACAMLGLVYGSADAVKFATTVAIALDYDSYEAGIALAREKGPAPIMEELFTEEDIAGSLDWDERASLIETLKGLYGPGPWKGRQVIAWSSNFLKHHGQKFQEAYAEIGSRFTHATSIAPTGTISLAMCNNASNGIEPTFSHCYTRNKIVAGSSAKVALDVYSYEFLLYKHLVNPGADAFAKEGPNKLPDYFVTTNDITPEQHMAMQAAFQPYVDSAISKTANVPTDFPFEDFAGIYMDAYDAGLKGFTTFRFNPEAFQGVLVNKSDLSNTEYEFILEDGSVVRAKGSDNVEYKGETFSAANLFDAIKEGYYGKL